MDFLKDKSALARAHSKRFSIASMGSLRWSYKSDRSEGSASTASSIASAPSSTRSDAGSVRAQPLGASQLGSSRNPHPARRHGKAPADSGFVPLYIQKMRQDDERRARQRARQEMELNNHRIAEE